MCGDFEARCINLVTAAMLMDDLDSPFVRDDRRRFIRVYRGRSVRTMLYDVPPLDPWAYGAGAILLAAVNVFAAFLPARRASRIEPMVALKRY